MNNKITRRKLLKKFSTAAATVALIGIPNFNTTQAAGLPPRISPHIVDTPSNIYDDIKREALAPISKTHRPLPLIASWNVSAWWNYDDANAGFYADWIIDQIKDNGYHLIPAFRSVEPDVYVSDPSFNDMKAYYNGTGVDGDPINDAQANDLPIIFVGTQWEEYLYGGGWFNVGDPICETAAKADNPCVWDAAANQVATPYKLSPFGNSQAWYNLGYNWGSSTAMQWIISEYPTPPKIFFVSNNEANKIKWQDAENDQHFRDAYPTTWSTMTDVEKRHAFATAWETRYDTLISGFKAGLQNGHWSRNSVFTGFQVVPEGAFFRYSAWKDDYPYDDGVTISWWFNSFDGGQTPVYSWPSNIGWDVRDNAVAGPLFQVMNVLFAIDEAYTINSAFYANIVAWHGDIESWNMFPTHGQTFTEDRYEGMAQFAMWIAMPRIMWHYEYIQNSRTDYLSWYQAIIDPVERVWNYDTLRSFWRNSTLVLHPTRNHPYQYNIPSEYSGVYRMCLLSTNLDPAEPWSMSTEFSVMALARVRGTSPNRQWLLYAYAPLGTRTNVQITIPDYQNVTVDVALEGSFYLINESTGSVTPITDYPSLESPADLHVVE